MKNLLIATVAFVVVASGSIAVAADLNLEVKAPPRGCGGGAFQGIYVGIHAGGVNHTANRTDQDQFLEDAASYILNSTSGVVGAQAGYNYQCRNFVFGIELDGSWTSANRRLRLFPNDPFAPILSITTNLDALVTARARAGIVAADNVLLYLTGGIAGVQMRTTWSFIDFGVDDTFRHKELLWGWVAGFGVEWALSERLSVRSEVLYIGLGDRDILFTSPISGPWSFVHSDSIWVARVGANIRLTRD